MTLLRTLMSLKFALSSDIAPRSEVCPLGNLSEVGEPDRQAQRNPPNGKIFAPKSDDAPKSEIYAPKSEIYAPKSEKFCSLLRTCCTV